MKTLAARPNLLPTAALVSLLVLLLGTAALFAISYTNQKSSEALDQLGHFHAAQVAAVEAQVSFKTQVQEWKDVLLRGRDSSDRAEYLARFAAQEQDAQAALKAVQDQLTTLGLALDAGRLASDHRALGVRYRSALAAADLSAPDAGYRIDLTLRGIDRPLNAAIDRLAHDTAAAADQDLTAFRAARADRYLTMRKVILCFGALAVLGAFALVWQALRGQAA